MTQLDVLNYISGALASVMWIAQIILIIKNKSSKDVSLITISVNMVVITLYLAWGIVNNILSAWITASISTLLSFVLLVMKLVMDVFIPLNKGDKVNPL